MDKTGTACMQTTGMSTIIKILRRRWEPVLVVVWLLCFTLLAHYFPRTGDDWGWALDGPARLATFFDGYNGRYAGDLLMVWLTSTNVWIATVVVAAGICAILVLALHLSDSRTPLGYGIATILLFTMPLGVWRQSIVWLSGFINYGLATIFLLLLLAVVKAQWSNPSSARAPLVPVLVAVAFIGQLFMEHVTICVVFLSAGLAIIYRKTHASWSAYLIAWVVGAICGAAAMFSNTAYRQTLDGTSTYQGISTSIGALLEKLFVEIPENAIVVNGVLNTALVVLSIAVVFLNSWQATRQGRVLVVAAAVYLALSIWLSQGQGVLPTSVRVFGTAAATIVFLAMLGLLVSLSGGFTFAGPEVNIFLLVPITLILTLGPLVVVNPIGPRCFFPSFVLIMIAVLALTHILTVKSIFVRPFFQVVVVHIVSLLLLGMMVQVYSTIRSEGYVRATQIRVAVEAGQSKIDISPLPYPGWVHDGDPYWSGLMERYKRYYGISPEMKVELVPNLWRATPQNPNPNIP